MRRDYRKKINPSELFTAEGLTNINIGNIHLLSDSAYPI